jgi:chemotaxis response regulator CheB
MMSRLNVLGIGAASGAQQSLTEFFAGLDSDLPIAVVLVSHVAADNLKKIEETLHRKTSMKIIRLEGDTKIEKGNVYLLAEGFIVKVKNGLLKVSPQTANDTPIIDIFFESLAEDYKSGAIGIILSGKGKDGVVGAIKISEHGGRILVQEPFSALYQSLPREVVKVDHPDKVLPAVRLAAWVNKEFVLPVQINSAQKNI